MLITIIDNVLQVSALPYQGWARNPLIFRSETSGMSRISCTLPASISLAEQDRTCVKVLGLLSAYYQHDPIRIHFYEPFSPLQLTTNLIHLELELVPQIFSRSSSILWPRATHDATRSSYLEPTGISSGFVLCRASEVPENSDISLIEDRVSISSWIRISLCTAVCQR